MEYQDFINRKQVIANSHGFDLDPTKIHPMLFDWQRDIVVWALRKGRAALFEDTGLGKTLQQIEWARHVADYTGRKVLILCPLAVAHQTIAEGKKIGVLIHYARSQEIAESCSEQIVICNYDMVEHLNPLYFAGVVLDESSILKSFTGATKRMLLTMFANTPYRLACTATPAPNDHLEFGNHAEFLGVMDSNKMISRWFINDTMQAGSYRLKHHAENDFWRWMTTWAVCIGKPSDLSKQYSDEGYILPPLNLVEKVVQVDHSRAHQSGQLFLTESLSATGMWAEKRATMVDRCKVAKDIIGDSDDYWIIWCDTNDEADYLMGLFPDALEVRGAMSVSEKEDKLSQFSAGHVKKIITKPEIAGFGLNWQHCHNQVFVGVTYSFEKTYQALRRSWRYRQTQAVNGYLIYAETEGNILKTIHQKQGKHREMQLKMAKAQNIYGLDATHSNKEHIEMNEQTEHGKDWTMLLGDCVTRSQEIADNSIDFSIFSPPFSNIYVYTDTPADMGNTQDDEEFFEHFNYLIPELWRMLKPGRLVAVHCKDLPLYMNRDGAAGLRDFPGDILRAFELPRFGSDYCRFVYHSKITIWKDPVIEMQRTKNHGLLWRNFSDRGEVVRQGMPDYVLVFRKWVDPDQMPDKQVENHPQAGEYIGDNPPTSFDSERDYSIQLWQRYASPVWFDINQTRVLNVRQARDNDSEKHICPLQLDVIARCVQIWTNKNDIVFSPFAGIGSEGVESLRLGRKFTGIELKDIYFQSACDYLREIEVSKNQLSFLGD